MGKTTGERRACEGVKVRRRCFTTRCKDKLLSDWKRQSVRIGIPTQGGQVDEQGGCLCVDWGVGDTVSVREDQMEEREGARDVWSSDCDPFTPPFLARNTVDVKDNVHQCGDSRLPAARGCGKRHPDTKNDLGGCPRARGKTGQIRPICRNTDACLLSVPGSGRIGKNTCYSEQLHRRWKPRDGTLGDDDSTTSYNSENLRANQDSCNDEKAQ